MKRRLLTPGPTPVPEETLLELARPVFYHRSAEFYDLMGEVLPALQAVFCTTAPVLPLTCSGTGGLEAALTSTVPAGGKVICLSAGRFGERWQHICAAFGMETLVVSAPYGQAVKPEQLKRALDDHRDAIAVCATLSETSTGVVHDIESFGKLTSKTGTLLLVDAISGLGAMECRTDAWHIDICCAGSQKALMMPPGLAFVSVSAKAWKVIDKQAGARSFYFDLRKARAKWEANDTPFTPAHTMLRAMRLSLRRMLDEGMENIWARQARTAAAARAGFEAMGLNIFPSPPNNALTVVSLPENIDSSALLSKLEKRYGMKIANGQGGLKGKIFRLGHMGYIDQFDILAALSGVELVLNEMGFPLVVGKSLAAAQSVLASS